MLDALVAVARHSWRSIVLSRFYRGELAELRRVEIADGRTTTDAIEEDLYRHRQELFGEVSIAFFDTTSLYFEGAGGQTLG